VLKTKRSKRKASSESDSDSDESDTEIAAEIKRLKALKLERKARRKTAAKDDDTCSEKSLVVIDMPAAATPKPDAGSATAGDTMSEADKKAAKKARQRADRAAAAVASPSPSPAPEAGTTWSGHRGVGKVDGGGGAGSSVGLPGIAENGVSIITCKPCNDGEVTWPQVKCEHCPHQDKWSRTHRVRDVNDFNLWHYTCLCCFALMRQLPITAAKVEMQNADPLMVEKRRRGEAFAKAREVAKQDFNMLDGKYKEVRKITISFLTQLMQPLAEFILEKQAAMERLIEDNEEIKLLQERLRSCSDGAEAVALVKRIKELKEQSRFIAFANHGTAMQKRFLTAQSFSDEWTNVAGHWYLGDQSECATLVLSKRWVRAHSDPLASKQKYYCPCCLAKYVASAGTLIEIGRYNSEGVLESTYGVGDVPEWDITDVAARQSEKQLKPASPEALFNLVREAHPQTNSLVRPATQKELYHETDDVYGVYKITDLAAVDRLQRWDWWVLLGLEKPVPKRRR
jgi:hypothetical protein